MSIKIDQAFITEMLAGGLAVDIVHENGAYSTWSGSAYATVTGVYVPQIDRPYLKIKTFPAGAASLDLNDTDDAVGLFQCIVIYPSGTGGISEKAKAEEVLALFKAGTKISYSGQVVNIISNSRDGGRPVDGYYQIVVRINYRAFVPK